jgi:ubiquinone/menaquinone biosynthesis C-methylase UbiE
MSTLQQDFDRIALVSEDGGAHNDHYHNFLLRHRPANCQNVLEIGCGTGAFARRLAERSEAGSAGSLPAFSASDRFSPAVRVLALDLSPEMIRLARERSSQFPNITFELADVRDRPLPKESFDCIVTIATLHHLAYAETLLQMKAALKPGGVLLVLDLFEPASISDSLLAGLSDSMLNLVAIPVSVTLRLIHHGRLLPRREVRAAWAAHQHNDLYPTMREVRDVCASILPGARIQQHLLWRYSIVWRKLQSQL